MTDPADLYESLQTEVGTVLVGNEDTLKHLTIALLTDGHVLLEGVPGVAKTTIATLFSKASGLGHSRIQMTPDLLPADITGTTVYRESTGEFETQKGPIFVNLVIADEINRAPPKTQSALLEAMQERQVSIEGSTLQLPDPFIVVATMNPIEMEGTFALPEAQRDRFQMKLLTEIPDNEEERAILDRFDQSPDLGADNISQTISKSEIQEARQAVIETHIADRVKDYIVNLVTATREHPDVGHGASPRAAIALQNTAKGHAQIAGRDYVIPDDIKSMVEPVLRHRLILNTDAEISDVEPVDIIDDVCQQVSTPSTQAETTETSPAVSDGGVPDPDS